MNMHEQINIDNQFQFKLLASLPPGDGLWSMIRMKKQNEKAWKMNMLAKSKTRKGGLGKNEHPDGLTTFKGNSGKNRGMWKIFPRWVENPKGRSRQNGMMKIKMRNNKKQTCKSIDHRCDVQSIYVTVPTCSNTIQIVFLYDFTASCLQAMVSMYLQTTASPEEELLQIYVRARAITCPIFQCLSVSAKFCLQIANHHAFPSIHTCIIMHPICSCIW